MIIIIVIINLREKFCGLNEFDILICSLFFVAMSQCRLENATL